MASINPLVVALTLGSQPAFAAPETEVALSTRLDAFKTANPGLALNNLEGQNPSQTLGSTKITFNPAFLQSASILPSSDKANGPGVPGGGGGNKTLIAFSTSVASLFSGLSQIPIASFPPGLSTLATSANAFPKFPAYCSELKAVTTSK